MADSITILLLNRTILREDFPVIILLEKNIDMLNLTTTYVSLYVQTKPVSKYYLFILVSVT